MNKEEIINIFLDKGFLVSPDFLESFNVDKEIFFKVLDTRLKSKEKPFVLTRDLFLVLQGSENISEINWNEFEKSRAFLEKGKNGKVYDTFLNILSYNLSAENKISLNKLLDDIKKPVEKVVLEKEEGYSNVMVLKNYECVDKKREVNDFVSYFKARHDKIRKILQTRQELQDVISINRVLNKKEKERVSIIGIVEDKYITKTGNVILTLEDNTGKISAMIRKEDKELFDLAKDTVLDEVIGIRGMLNKDFIFCNTLCFPGIPTKELKTVNDDTYVVFTADLHFGNKNFLMEDFLKFIDWINCKTGDKAQKEIASKVKYLFIVGDIVDGVGIFPGQEDELAIKDIYNQYEKCAELLSKIRKDIHIVICAGNHDALRISEPQPVLDKKLAKAIWELPNVTMVTNPSLINIHSSKDFDGFNILLYHGYSFPYYAGNVESIRAEGGATRADLIMKFLLDRRHLAPTHASTLYIPNLNDDQLVIEKIPDFFITAHIHRTVATNYKGVTLIGCGCWIPQTPYQEKTGLFPDPSKISIVNLKTREFQIMNFGE